MAFRQNHPGQRVDGILRDQVLDAIGRLLFDPGVDLLAGSLGIVLEIDREDAACAVRVVDRIDVGLLEGIGLFAPQGVGHA